MPGQNGIAPDILTRGDVFVEFEPQSRIEGEIQHMPEDFPVTGTVLKARKKAVQTRQVTSTRFRRVCGSGFFTVIPHKIEGTDYYETLNIIGELDDPRNLFGIVKNGLKD